LSAENRKAAAGAGLKSLSIPGLFLLALLTFTWGANWPAMKIVLGELPVWTFRSMCLLFGGVCLLVLARLAKENVRVPRSEIRPLLFCCLLNVIGWHLLTGYGVSLIPAGRASIIAFTMPVWAAILGSIFLGERLTLWRILGLILGMAGMAVLIGPDLRHLETAPWGALLMLGAAITWASGIVAIKSFTWSISPGAQAGWQLLIASVPISIGAFFLDGPPDFSTLSPKAYLALAYVLVMAMVFSHWAWFRIMHLFPTVVASVGTLAIPVVGVFSSALVLGEKVGAQEVLALLFVSSALLVVLIIPAIRQSR